ncbi:hypothetical protein EUGRSUZ_B02927 [Eucalyptus grandis]|uniref:Uncharacterized protein n=2 Tax=Eucalyptus grandis TaxID=71139 RepID=A0ACC3LUJ2_EUCGR|nr:hypothetical protein EUGRSUZ_B02927 [Eucalyptus grandis]
MHHSTYAIIAAVVGSLSFIYWDDMHTLVLNKSIDWWSMWACLLGIFFFFSSPLVENPIKPSYLNFSRWHIAWISVATLYHFPISQSIGADLRMNLSLYLTIYSSSILFLAAFHIIFIGLSYIGLVSPEARRRPELWNLLQKSTHCLLWIYSHCGNRAYLKQTPFEGKCYGWFSFGKKEERNRLISKFLRMNEFKDEICSCWFAPVGSANDYPFWSKWVMFGQGASYPEEISPLYSLWATFTGLYIVDYLVERSTGWALTHHSSAREDEQQMRPLSVEEEEQMRPLLVEEEEQMRPLLVEEEQMRPHLLNLVPWYSGTSADLFKTVFDLIVSATVFLGRFDMRVMQAAVSKAEHGVRRDFLYDHSRDKEDFWFDFVADTGDGWNSSYCIARLLAQPELNVETSSDSELPLPPGNHHLQRGNLLLIGGDLAYPNPTPDNYEYRFFRPFMCALQPPPTWYKSEQIAVDKPEIPLEFSDGPRAFIIPGNHDWFDGLHTFTRYICHNSWLGGWFMPQKKSYFALRLPKNWWVFGLDLALHEDIDVYQFKFFSELVKKEVDGDDSVIILTHAPKWLLDWYSNDVTGKNSSNNSGNRNRKKSFDESGKNFSHLIRDYLKGRCKLQIAGDLHHYMRHSVPENTSAYVEHLLVNGCGGAFLHPTHVFGNFKEYCGATYETEASYPSFEDSSKIALPNIWKFREKNWQFDIIGGIIYFVLAFSMFPQCDLDQILQDDSGHLRSFSVTVWATLKYLLEQSYVSLAGALLFLIALIAFAPKVSRKKRVMMGLLHFSAHLTSVIMLVLLMELGLEACIRHKFLATSDYHSLYQWYRTVECEYFPDPTGLRVRMEQWTFGLYPACIKYLMSAFDVPEVMAVSRTDICQNRMESLSRGVVAIYYASVFVYFWVFSTPVVSLVFGSYLYICVNWLHLHYDEAFSSLRIADYKGFTRFHIDKKGDLEVYTLAVDEVPKDWNPDPDWRNEPHQPERSSHLRKFPSMWRSADPLKDPVKTVRIEDYFVIHRNGENRQETPGPAQPEPESEQSLNSENEIIEKEPESFEES